MRKTFLGLLLVVVLILFRAQTGVGYIMPAEQLIAFMAKNFSKFQSLVIIQTTLLKAQGQEVEEEKFTEKIWIKSPNLFHAKVLDAPAARETQPDTTFRELFMAKGAERLPELLASMGVHLDSVGLTRFEGSVAYRIGERGPEQPKMLIDKETFLPLFLQYRPPRSPALERVSVKFEDYKKAEGGWYPFKVIYSDAKGYQEEYTIHTLQANLPIDPALFFTPRVETESDRGLEQGQVPPDEERLREIIQKFEEKYQ